MNHGLHPDMIEATRLTRAGRLSEATALLQRVLGSGTAPDPASGPTGDTAHAPAGRGSPIIDLTPDTIELTDPQAPLPARQAAGTAAEPGRPAGAGKARSHLPEALRSFLDRVKAPLSTGAARTLSAARTRRRAARRPVSGSLLWQPGGKARLQALRPERLPWAGSPPGRHAARLHQSPDDFAAGHADERARRRAHLLGRLSCPGRLRQCLEVLELVQSERPTTRPGRALADRRHHAAGDARTRSTRSGSMSRGSRPVPQLPPSWE